MKTSFLSVSSRLALGTAGLCVLVVYGCNSITGADAIRFDGESDPDDTTTGSSSNPPPEKLYAPTGVTITEIALYQGIKRPLMANGALATSDIPVVEGRDAMLRVFITPDTTYAGTPLTAHLSLSDADPPIVATQTTPGASTDDALDSTFNFDIPGAMIKGDFQYSVRLGQLEKSASDTLLAYPASGLEVVGAQTAGPALKVKLVPVAYGADGSDRVPDTSEATIELFRKGYLGVYPIASVEVTVREPVQWNNSVGAFGQGWSQLLDHILSVRQQDGAPADQYYYGIFAPAASFGQYCNSGCVLGLAPLNMGVGDMYGRAAIGVSYGDQEAVATAIHETGHTHSREHAPCMVQDPDPSYPHSGGKIGVWGYDPNNKKLFPPTAPDFMGYCSPHWVSDYTFLALFDRMKAVNGASLSFPKELLNRTYDRVLIDAEGDVEWREPLTLQTPPMAEPTPVVLETPAGDQTITGQLYRFDHLPGGVLLWPQAESTYKAARLRVSATKMAGPSGQAALPAREVRLAR